MQMTVQAREGSHHAADFMSVDVSAELDSRGRGLCSHAQLQQEREMEEGMAEHAPGERVPAEGRIEGATPAHGLSPIPRGECTPQRILQRSPAAALSFAGASPAALRYVRTDHEHAAFSDIAEEDSALTSMGGFSPQPALHARSPCVSTGLSPGPVREEERSAHVPTDDVMLRSSNAENAICEMLVHNSCAVENVPGSAGTAAPRSSALVSPLQQEEEDKLEQAREHKIRTLQDKYDALQARYTTLLQTLPQYAPHNTPEGASHGAQANVCLDHGGQASSMESAALQRAIKESSDLHKIIETLKEERVEMLRQHDAEKREHLREAAQQKVELAVEDVANATRHMQHETQQLDTGSPSLRAAPMSPAEAEAMAQDRHDARALTATRQVDILRDPGERDTLQGSGEMDRLQGERVQSRDLAQFQQDKGRLETEAAARESDRTEAEEVHADVVAALAAATLKIQDLELQLLHHHSPAYAGSDLPGERDTSLSTGQNSLASIGLAASAADSNSLGVAAAAEAAAAPTNAAGGDASHRGNVAEAHASVRAAGVAMGSRGSGDCDGDDGDSAVSASICALAGSSKELEGPADTCIDPEEWSDMWLFDQVSSRTGVAICLCVYVSECLCVYIYRSTHVHTYVYTYIRIRTYAHTYVYTHVYAYIHVHTHTQHRPATAN